MYIIEQCFEFIIEIRQKKIVATLPVTSAVGSKNVSSKTTSINAGKRLSIPNRRSVPLEMAKLFDLRPQKSLLDASFEGYKLSLEPLAVYRHELPVGVHHLQPSEEQYSYEHAKTFGFHNHLHADLWHTDGAYFFARDGQLFHVGLHSLVCFCSYVE